MKKNTYYLIKKTIVEKGITVYINNSLGETVEFEKFKEASKFCEILNSNSDNNCKYEIEGK
jgi:hypothetical protein